MKFRWSQETNGAPNFGFLEPFLLVTFLLVTFLLVAFYSLLVAFYSLLFTRSSFVFYSCRKRTVRRQTSKGHKINE